MKDVPSHPYRLPELDDEARIAAARGFYEEVATRRSCRFFADAPVPREVIEQAIRAAGTAPNGANHQPWHFAVVESAAAKRRIREAAEAEERAFYAGKAGEEWLETLAPIGTDWEKPFLETAPYLIAVFAQRKGGPEPGDRKQNYYVTESVGIACGLLLAALHRAGLATLTHTPSPMGFLREICGRPADERPMMIIVAGLPAADATYPLHAARKKPLDRITSWL
ncbi:nitroreductase family protein [Sphingomicrobium astaxanthinifaciens]|uniref:nitroreductase family protein n=1 Tax=Sphingomicrobium astaxanthinifaciens TaxID=1227949 RepID=UPI001FCB7ACA|nr:nitroreductase family protein [Sphingomicrobium astaxanthinifaciens]MCJ7421623.1 nitroreductase family protein [Sphingomicrobium astaxanthinifaciens]